MQYEQEVLNHIRTHGPAKPSDIARALEEPACAETPTTIRAKFGVCNMEAA